MVVGQADEMWRRLKRKFGQALSAKASSGAARESTTTLGGMFGEQTSRWHTGAAENATLERVGCIAPTSRTVADLDAMADALRCSEVFLRLEDELLDIVAAATTWEVLAPDEVICDEQSVDSTVLLVVRGKLSVLTRDRDSVAVYDLGPGDTFSDYSADSRRNVASVSASSDNVALLQLLRPQFMAALVRARAEAQKARVRLVRSVGVFGALDPDQLSAIAERLHAHPATRGETIVAQGADAKKFYIIEHGQCIVTRRVARTPAADDTRAAGGADAGLVLRLCELGPSEVFGDMSDGPQPVSVVAKGNVRLQSISKAELMALADADVVEEIGNSAFKPEDDALLGSYDEGRMWRAYKSGLFSGLREQRNSRRHALTLVALRAARQLLVCSVRGGARAQVEGGGIAHEPRDQERAAHVRDPAINARRPAACLRRWFLDAGAGAHVPPLGLLVEH